MERYNPKIINYLKECFEADNHKREIFDIFKSLDKLLFLNNEEQILTGLFDELQLLKVITGDFNFYKYYFKNRKEKDVLYCPLILCGNIIIEEKSEKICAPVLYYGAELTLDEILKFKINKDDIRFNRDFFRYFTDDNLIIDSCLDKLSTIFDGQIYNETLFIETENELKKLIPSLSSDDNLLYPILSKEKDLTNYYNGNNEIKLFHPGIIGLIDKSRETRGIINELNEISKTENPSLPIKYLTGCIIDEKKRSSDKAIYLPISITSAQKKIINNSLKYPLSVAIGPPGTGKSYTIASLAVEGFITGKKILIVSKNGTAVDVIANKIEEILGNKDLVVRAGKSGYLKKMITGLENILFGFGFQNNNDVPNLKYLHHKILKLSNRIKRINRIYRKESISYSKYGKLFIEMNNNLIQNYLRKKITKKTQKYKLHDRISMLNKLSYDYKENYIKYINEKHKDHIENMLSNNKNDLQFYIKFLKARSGNKRDEYLKRLDSKILFEAFPIWLSDLSTLSKVLPLEKELFDIVIIDEATQCDSASVIPALYRAKKAVVVGDPKQLRHISFLSNNFQNIIADKYNMSEYEKDMFNYRNNSVLDLVLLQINDKNKMSFLDEHYRSQESIIKFSSNEFYGNSLKIMTKKPFNIEQSSIILKECNGIRNDNGVNIIEAEEIVKDIIKLVDNEKDYTKDICSSIGILSPFREQTDYIYDLLSNQIDIYILEKHNILQGTAYSFQGDERDCMFMSFCVDKTSHLNTMIYLNKPDVFNVSITRARNYQYVYTSVNSSDIEKDSFFKRYLNYITFYNKNYISKKDNEIRNEKFFSELKTELDNRNISFKVSYPVTNIFIDVLALINKRYIGIDLIGYPGKFQNFLTNNEITILSRCQIEYFPISFAEWTICKDVILEKLFNLSGGFNDN